MGLGKLHVEMGRCVLVALLAALLPLGAAASAQESVDVAGGFFDPNAIGSGIGGLAPRKKAPAAPQQGLRNYSIRGYNTPALASKPARRGPQVDQMQMSNVPSNWGSLPAPAVPRAQRTDSFAASETGSGEPTSMEDEISTKAGEIAERTRAIEEGGTEGYSSRIQDLLGQVDGISHPPQRPAQGPDESTRF